MCPPLLGFGKLTSCCHGCIILEWGSVYVKGKQGKGVVATRELEW